MNHLVAPSMLSANFACLKDDIQLINNSKADWFHLDIMDGKFVPNITFGFPVIKAIKKLAKKPLDVHLMIIEPEKYLTQYKEVGADILTVHYETSVHLHRTIQAIKEMGMDAGVAINPHTPVSSLEEIINDTDHVCLMSVNPGFGGQSFIENSIGKIKQLKMLIQRKNATAKIEVDGGVTLNNAKDILQAGANVLVAGNTVFSSDDPTQTIAKLKDIQVETILNI